MNRILIALISACMIGLWTRPAMAYIDPGSGSAIMSVIIGFFVATGLLVKTFWYKLKSLFVGKTTHSNDAPDDQPNDTE